jgi:protein SCO1/2
MPQGRAIARQICHRARDVSGRRLLFVLLVVLCIAVIPSVVVPTLMCRPEPPQLEQLGRVPAFQMIDHEGLPFTEEALRGHPTIVDFVFTRCDTICPAVSMRMEQVEQKTRDKRGAPIKFLSISVDPEHDTPDKLAAYAARYHADARRWKFITGKPADVKALVEGGFMTSMERNGNTPSGAPNIVHRGYFMLVDGDLEIRGIYESSDVRALDELMHHARYLARTHRGGYKFGGT